MAATTAFREALNEGISCGNLVDTKIILYSHRNSWGHINRPKALYASSHVLKTVPYFNGLLFGGFAESQSEDFNKGAVGEDGSAEHYGYSSDSDLEDSDDEKDTPPEPVTKSKVHPFRQFSRRWIRSSPSNSETGRTKLGSGGNTGGECLPVPIPSEDEKTLREEHEEHVDKGKVVKIPDMAFVTFQAFLMYLYTDAIEFAPFGSDENRRSRRPEAITPLDDKVPRPSPKSIYRLADKYDVPALKALALDHILGGLEKCDIVEEAFSRFASQYDEVRKLYVEQLAHVWMEDPTETTSTRIDKKIESFVEEGLKHATETLSALWEIANKDCDVKAPTKAPTKTPAKTLSATTQVTSPEHLSSVNTALIKSIRKGVFFDRKYWARHSKAGDALKPVYFSSAIMGDRSQQLNELVKYLKSKDTLVKDLGDLNVESDCEDGSTGPESGAPKVAEERGEEARAVFIVGSFSAWKSLFFYRCTDTILFAPLKSQGVDTRLKHIRENTSANSPPPCSPKSIYVLAKLLEIEPLYKRAFGDIKSKVSEDNVVDEVFSRVPASHKEFMEMQSDLLVSKLGDPKTITTVKENIGHIFDEPNSHCADLLKLGLKKAFDLKKQKRQLPGIKPR